MSATTPDVEHSTRLVLPSLTLCYDEASLLLSRHMAMHVLELSTCVWGMLTDTAIYLTHRTQAALQQPEQETM